MHCTKFRMSTFQILRYVGLHCRCFAKNLSKFSREMASATDENAETPSCKMGFGFEEVQGDLFSCPESWSMAHCISEDCRMGKGIAVLFKKNFDGVDELIKQGKKTGDVAILKRGDRFVYYLITKEKAFHKPTLNSLKLSLQATREHCRTHGVKCLAMPMIGCGLDRLQWKDVSKVIKETFVDTDIKIRVYYL